MPQAAREPLDKAFDLLAEMIDAGGEPAGVRELATRLGMAPSTVHRVLAVLERRCLVQRDDAGRYGLGLELFRWAQRVSSLFSLRETALPYLRQLAHETTETTLLGAYNPNTRMMMYTASIESPYPLRYVLEQERWRPVYAGATGLAIMAFLPEADQDAVIADTGLAPLTPRTIGDPAVLRRELAKIRDRGYALTSGQNIPGAVGLAAPVFDARGAVVGDVCITIPDQRFDPAKQDDLIAGLVGCARRISELLGCPTDPGAWPPTAVTAATAVSGR